ncbi:MAG: acyl-CoA dehydrogenase family protein [Nitrososphaeria archaeon]
MMISNVLLGEDEKRIKKRAIEFVKSIPTNLLLDMDAEKISYPKEFLTKAADFDLLGLRFPKEYHGKELGWTSEVAALEEIGILGTALGCLYSLVSIVGEAINIFGTKEQKENFLKPTIQAKIATAEGLTEPRGGSDFFGATTTAKREGDYFILNGQKRFIVGGEGADYFLVYAKTDPEAEPHKSMTAFLVKRDKNLEVKHIYGLLGTRGGGTARISFNNMKISIENVLGGEKGINKGTDVFYQMMIPERMTSAAASLGIAKIALDIAAKYSTKRKSFSKPIRNYQAVSFKVADGLIELDAARALVYETATAIDKGDDPSRLRRLVSECKSYATDMAWRVVNNSMQIMGGIGYTNIYPIERLLRDTRLIMIWTGTNEIMKLIIQHEFYKEILSKKEEIRDLEMDAINSGLEEEKVYE